MRDEMPKSMNRVLIVAYHFPPCIGSSGLLRSAKFATYLPEFGWDPVVLTLSPRAYESTDPRTAVRAAERVKIVRAFALDTKRHLGFRGLYLSLMALPDRWVSWVLGAIPSGLRAIRQYHVEVIFSTFPIATAILIGFILHRLTGKPWVVDLRDSMTEDDYPKDARTRNVRRWIEKKVIKHAYRIIFTAPSTLRMYLARYSELSKEKCLLIPNGFDEEDFARLKERLPAETSADEPIRLLHTGLIYPEERDPRPFFGALARLKHEGKISKASLRISFRASGSEALFQQMIDTMDIADLVELRPHIPYHEALQECADADGLLLFQAASCDHQIPAKAYEYLRLRKPIFALTTHTGDTAALLREVGGATIVNLSEPDQIYTELPVFLDAIRAKCHPSPDAQRVEQYARRNQAGQLARCLDALHAAVPVRQAEKAHDLLVEKSPVANLKKCD